MRLTDLRIKQLKVPASGQKAYYDDILPGFGCRISQGGTKSFVVMFGTKRRLKTLGSYPAMGLAEARREAKRIQSDAEILADPVKAAETISFADARTLFLADSQNSQQAAHCR